MRYRKVLLPLSVVLLLIVATAGAALLWFENSPRRTPPGQPALSRLDAATLPAFRDAFNADAEFTRVVVLLSPT